MSSWHGSRRYRSSLFYGRRLKETRKYCGLTRKDILTILSSLLLPLMLGIFTVVITFDQKNSSREQRLEDRRLADEQRNQDLNISRQQRLEDRESSREQRLQDLNQSILQRELERTIANEVQNISEQNRKHQLEIEDKHYRDNLLTNYITEISYLLEKTNESLTNISLISTLIRLKTLTLIRQLDSNRNNQVIRFLYEAGQLNTQNKFPLDLSDVELFHIDLSSKKPAKKMHNLYLPNVDLTDCSFVNRDLSGSNFSSTILIDVNFSSTNLTNTDFSYTIFNGSFNIYNAVLHDINLSYANLTGIDFFNTLLNAIEPSEFYLRPVLSSMNFSNAELTNTRFSGVLFTFVHFRKISNNINFSNTILKDVIFESIDATYLNFSYSTFVHNVTFSDIIYISKSSFLMATMDNVNFIKHHNHIELEKNIFDFANLSNIQFVGIRLSESSFVNAIIMDSTFSNCDLDDCTFINVTMSNVEFSGSIEFTNFDNAILQDNFIFSDQSFIVHSTFRRAQMQNLIANHCEFFSVDMNEVNLTNSTMFASRLSKSNLINTDFTGANLSMIDLSYSNMFNATITDEQLHSAFSIENSILPNGTIGHDITFIKNGNADCNKIIEQDWKVEPSNSIIMKKWKTNQSDCMFIANTINTIITMSQTINVTRYKPILNRSLTKLRITHGCNDHVNINVIQRDVNYKILNIWMVYDSDDYSSPNFQTTYIEVKLQFDTNGNNTAICDNIIFKIELDWFR